MNIKTLIDDVKKARGIVDYRDFPEQKEREETIAGTLVDLAEKNELYGVTEDGSFYPVTLQNLADDMKKPFIITPYVINRMFNDALSIHPLAVYGRFYVNKSDADAVKHFYSE